jgi:hypothetical protein
MYFIKYIAVHVETRKINANVENLEIIPLMVRKQIIFKNLLSTHGK